MLLGKKRLERVARFHWVFVCVVQFMGSNALEDFDSNSKIQLGFYFHCCPRKIALDGA